MEIINQIFSFYDHLLTMMSPTYATFLSLGILIFLLYSIYNFIKGNIIWIIAVVIFVPASISAIKILTKTLFIIFTFLIVKIKI